MRDVNDQRSGHRSAHVPPGPEQGGPLALRISEERFRLAFENAHVGMCLVGLDGRLLQVNKRLCSMSGYSREELTALSFHDITHADDAEVAATFVRRAFAGELDEAHFQKRYVRKDGQIVWAQVTSSLVRDPAGNPLNFVTHIEDITECVRLQTAEEEQRTLAEGLLESVSLVHACQSQDEVAARIMGIARRIVPHIGMHVLLVDEQEGIARVAGACPCYAQNGRAGPHPDAHIVIAQSPVLRRMSATRAPVVIADTCAEPGWSGWYPEAAAWVCSYAGVPIRSDGELLGFLSVESDKRGAFGEQEARRLQALADPCGMALWQLRRTDELRRDAAGLELRVAERTRRLSALYQVTALTSQHLDLETTLERSLRLTLGAVGCRAATIHLLEATGDRLWMAAQSGLAVAMRKRLGKLRAPGGLLGRVLLRQKPVLVPDIGADAQAAQTLGDCAYGVYVGVPVRVGGRSLGVLSLFGREGQAVNADDLDLLTSIADHLGAAVESADLNERAEQAAAAAERHRLARDLHDAVTQTLFSAALIAEVLPRLWKQDQAEAERNLEKLHELTRAAQTELRALLVEMRPAAVLETPLSTLVRHLGDTLASRAGVSISFSATKDMHLPPDVHLAFFRIAQEALNNIAQHARARHAELTLRRRGRRMEMRIVDDGMGFDPAALAPDHLGIGIMRERAELVGASFRLDSTPGHGTLVVLTWEPGAMHNVESREAPVPSEAQAQEAATPMFQADSVR